MTKFIAAASALALASVACADIYSDATFDTFTNDNGNLDIASVEVTNDASNLYISVTTRDFASWTKYMVFMNTQGGGNGSNGWNRPVNLNGQTADHFIGSWVDQGSNNQQLVAFNNGGWDWGNVIVSSNSVGGNTVTFTCSLSSLGLGIGSTMRFDVATTGGGDGDSGIDHLSRDTEATDWWTNPSTAGSFLSYTVVPAPGAIALLGVAGLVGGRRRR